MGADAEILVSVVVPVYNGARHLAGCVENLRRQTLSAWEAVFVDDGSTDDSLSILGELAATEPRMRVIHQENGGVSSARNRGLAEAGGRYVFFLDADDRVERDAFERMAGMLEQTGSPFILAGYVTYPAGSENREYRPPFFYGLKPRLDMEITPWMMVNMIPFVWANMYSRHFLLENRVHFLPLKIAEDVMFTMTTWLLAGRASVTPEAFYHYIRQEDSAMGANERKPMPVQRYLRYYKEMGGLFRRFSAKGAPGFSAKAAAAYVIMLREKGAAETYKRHDPVHDYAWICRGNRALRGRLWKYASKWRIGWYLARIVLFKIRQKFFRSKGAGA